jgi:6-pyruvoyltetrahydropterin/6-carboxytetrahydropterin synthase
VFELVFTRRYAMAHRLRGDSSGRCAVPHGHNETVTARLVPVSTGRLDGSSNMVEPFERAKQRWHAWIDEQVDHAFQLGEDDPLIGYFAQAEPQRLARLLITPGDPTTELLAVLFKAKLETFLAAEGGRLACATIAIEETPTNQVVFSGAVADALPAGQDGDRWWTRADSSINDLKTAVLARARS